MDFSEKQRIVTLIYHHEQGSWWAESPDLPSLFAGGDTLDEAKELAHQVVGAEIGADAITIEWMPVPEPLRPVITRGAEPPVYPRVKTWPSRRFAWQLTSPANDSPTQS